MEFARQDRRCPVEYWRSIRLLRVGADLFYEGRRRADARKAGLAAVGDSNFNSNK